MNLGIIDHISPLCMAKVTWLDSREIMKKITHELYSCVVYKPLEEESFPPDKVT